MNKTTIEWCVNPDGTPGYTLNVITGCLNGCTYCYARKLANGRLKSKYLANNTLPCHQEPDHEAHHRDPFYPRFWPESLDELENRAVQRGRTTLLYGRKPRGIFVCDMGDLFGIGVPEDWTQAVMDAIKADPIDRFYLLTKQPQNLARWSPFPDNCWVGVSATNARELARAINQLQGEIGDCKPVKDRIKYISLEPLLNWNWESQAWLSGYIRKIDWLIIGAVTRHPELPQPKPEWIREIVEAAEKAGVKVFLKDSLYDLLLDAPHDDLFWEDMSHLRQELPK